MGRGLLLAAVTALVPAAAIAYPNGTPLYVTDAAPFCAACHAVGKADSMPELPAEGAARETIENKHYAAVRSTMPGNPYGELAPAQREKLIEEAKAIDAHSSIFISAPVSAKPGEEIKVLVKAQGGNGPAIGVMLVDWPLRFQARPASAEGWTVVGEPEVLDQRKARQQEWLDARLAKMKKNLSFILVREQTYDAVAGVYPAAEITYTLRAPATPGTYGVTAALLYGTENALTAGVTARPSGRILFSERVECRVE